MAQFVSKDSGFKSFGPLTQSQAMLPLCGSVPVKTIAQVRLNHLPRRRRDLRQQIVLFLVGLNSHLLLIIVKSITIQQRSLSARMKSEAVQVQIFSVFPIFYFPSVHIVAPHKATAKSENAVITHRYQIPKMPLRSGVRNTTFWRFKMRY